MACKPATLLRAMATTKLYLDTRAVSAGEAAPLKISLTKHGKTALYSLDIRLLPSQWDNHRQVILNHPNKLRLNNFIRNRKTEFDNYLMQLTDAGELALMTATQIKNRIAGLINPDDAPESADLFLARYRSFADTRNKEHTREIYGETMKKILSFDSKARRLSFDDITKSWLDRFEHYLSSEEHLAPNTIAIHLRNIRAVVNDAIDNEITGTYAFRKKKIKYQATPKRSFTLERLQELWNYPVEPFQQKYVDAFKLSFLLIGINVVDICKLTSENIVDGRLEYIRSKTGRFYSIKLEPEAIEILERYKGKQLLFGPAEGFAKYKTFSNSLDRGLKNIGPVTQTRNPNWKSGSKKHRCHIERSSAFPGISIYWARHSWATIAAEIDIPDATISAGLGHGHGDKTTAIYVNFRQRKVDESNRRVIDYVLGVDRQCKGSEI